MRYTVSNRGGYDMIFTERHMICLWREKEHKGAHISYEEDKDC